MGNGISKRKKEKDLRLPNSGLKFSPSQLSSLNCYFSDQLANLSGEPKCAGDAYDVVERLMLRMLSGVGTLDPRFSSKFLIDLDPTKAAAKKMAPRWTEEMTIKFMELYREHPCLWDQFNESYNNKFARQNALSDIASKMNIEGFDSVEVNRKIKALRSTYHSEKSKQLSSEHSGAPTEETFKSTLKWFDQMKYIMTTGAVKRKKRTSQSETLAYKDCVVKGGSHNLSYLVRLDRLSEPLLYPEHEEQPTCHVTTADGGPPGHAKLRITGCRAEEWAEFVNNHGYLRRDKVQERFVELLAQSAARSSVPEPPSRLDESRLCGCPGKVVDPDAAFHIISTPPQEQFYFGAADCHRHSFPDPRDFRLAIVEGTPCVRLRVGLLPPLAYSSSEEDIQVTLTLGIGFSGWPQGSDFPTRVPLSHVDILLYQQAANMGFYLVPAPPHPTARCDDRSASWQFRFPASECALLAHYAPHSVPARTLATLRHLLADIRRTTNGGHVVSDYMLKTFLWFRLEEDHESLVEMLHNWDHNRLSTHVLVILDRLMGALRTQRHRSYWMPWFNVMLSAPGGGTPHYSEEDYCHDAEVIGCQLRRLLEPMMPQLQSPEPWQALDSRLVTKWQDVLIALAPPNATRSRRLRLAGGCTMTTHYSARQLQYIRHVLRGMLTVRSHTLYQERNLPCLFQNNEFITPNNNEIDSSEDLIYFLTSILEQANALHTVKRSHESNKRKTSHGRSLPKRGSVRSEKRIDSFETAVRKLMDEVRKDMTKPDLTTDTVLVKEVLRWLYYGKDFDRHHLFPVLRPYLNRLFTVSHENCWHVDEWKRRQDNQELFALGRFARLVVEEGLSPRDGISDAIQKGWHWGERVLETAAQCTDGVELVFTPAPGRVLRYRVRLHQASAHGLGTRSLGRNLSRGKADTKIAFATLPRHTNGIEDLLKAKEYNSGEALFESLHARLRAANPIVNAIDTQRRYGTHRGLGSIVEALVTLNKFSVLQEVSNLLPEDEQAQVLDDIQRVSKERRRGRRPRPGNEPPTQLYRQVPENITVDRREKPSDVSANEWLAEIPPTSKTLLGTCREARQRQGHMSMYEGAFFSPPFTCNPNPLGQPFLTMTADNDLALSTSETGRRAPIVRTAHKKEMVTKL